MTKKPWGSMNPNSQNQLWSKWTFTVVGRPVAILDLRTASLAWLRKVFGSHGRARVRMTGSKVIIEAQIEGAPAQDPEFVKSVRQRFSRFVFDGFGRTAMCNVKVKILSGDAQDGRPRNHLVVMPGDVGWARKLS